MNNQGYFLADSAAAPLQSGTLAQNTYSLVSKREPELAALLRHLRRREARQRGGLFE